MKAEYFKNFFIYFSLFFTINALKDDIQKYFKIEWIPYDSMWGKYILSFLFGLFAALILYARHRVKYNKQQANE
jgi:hypothetical protein